MKIKNNDISNESNQTQFCSNTEKILQNVEFLQESFSSISSLHALYFETIKNIQIHLIEQIKNNQFEEASFGWVTHPGKIIDAYKGIGKKIDAINQQRLREQAKLEDDYYKTC